MDQLADDGSQFRVGRERYDGQAVLRLEGQLDLSTAHVLDAEISRLGELLSRSVVVDLHGLEFLDCAGVRPLVRLADELNAHRGRLVVSGASRLVSFVLTTAGVSDSTTE